MYLATCASANLYLLDESTKGLDGFYKRQLGEIFARLKEQGTTIIMVSHDIENAMKYSNKILHMRENDYFFGTKEEYIKSMEGKEFLNYDR